MNTIYDVTIIQCVANNSCTPCAIYLPIFSWKEISHVKYKNFHRGQNPLPAHPLCPACFVCNVSSDNVRRSRPSRRRSVFQCGRRFGSFHRQLDYAGCHSGHNRSFHGHDCASRYANRWRQTRWGRQSHRRQHRAFRNHLPRSHSAYVYPRAAALHPPPRAWRSLRRNCVLRKNLLTRCGFHRGI